MRTAMCIGASIATIALAAAAAPADTGPKPRPTPPAAAASAERHGVGASWRGPTPGHGYTERERRIADCLTTYRTYDPVADRIITRRGESRPCPL